jgi:hypothetical protein
MSKESYYGGQVTRRVSPLSSCLGRLILILVLCVDLGAAQKVRQTRNSCFHT